MVYLDYHKSYIELDKAKGRYYKISNKIENLRQLVDVLSSKYDTLKVDGSKINDSIDEYCATIALLTDKEKDAYRVIGRKQRIVDNLLEDLKISKHLQDKIYYMKYILEKDTQSIASSINYGLSRTYDYLKMIEKEIKIIEQTYKK